MPKTTKRSLSC